MNSRFLIIVLVVFASSLSAQIDFGIKAIYSHDLTSDVAKEYVTVEPLELAQIGFTGAAPTKGIGMSLYTENAKLFFMGDVLYTVTGRNFELISLEKTRTPLDPALELTSTESNFRLALNTGFLVKNFKVGFGPELSLRLDQQEDLSTLVNVENRGTDIQGGFNFIIGYKVTKNIHVDLKHTYIFQDAGHDFTYGGIPMELKRNQKSLELSVGLYF